VRSYKAEFLRDKEGTQKDQRKEGLERGEDAHQVKVTCVPAPDTRISQVTVVVKAFHAMVADVTVAREGRTFELTRFTGPRFRDV
jgi:hypothetical protein